ncbi:MAG TPA: MFS transporter [Candidatus Saccharimonadia bacterium]
MLYLRLFKYADFAKLWSAQILSGISQNLLNFSLIILVYELTLGSQFANLSVSLLVLTFGLPALLFAPIAGAYVDHWDRKKVLVVSNLLRAGLVLLYVFFDHNLSLILIISFIVSTILQFFVPAESASIPNVVPKNLLLAANSLFIFSLYASFIIGYSGSGPAIHYLGPHGPYWVVAGMLLLAALLTSTLDLRSVKRRSGPLPRLHPVKHLRNNWRIITSQRDRLFSALQLTVTQAMVSVLITLAPALSLAVLHIPLKQASHILIIPVGVGLVLGVVLVTTISKRLTKMRLIQGGLITAGITLTLVGLSGQLYRTHDGQTLLPLAVIPVILAVLMLLLGMLNALISAAAQTMLQESTNDENRGKVFASLNMMVNLAATTPILLTGLLADLLSVTKVITMLGVIATVYALYITWRYRRSVVQPS